MFSATVICGNSASDWNTMPKSRWFAGKWVMSRPAKFTLPELGVSSPAIMRSRVVLPQPDGPRKHTSLPSGHAQVDVVDGVRGVEALGHGLNVRWVMMVPAMKAHRSAH